MESNQTDIVHHNFPFGGYQFTTLVICSYLVALKVISKVMTNRPAYDLKTFMMVYNLYQIVACVWAMKMYLDTGVAFWELYCPETKPILSSVAYETANFMYWIKVSEMSETIVFLLRKKNSQVTPLHVFHHCITVTFVYVSCAFDLESGVFMAAFVNSLVHVFMYSYYLITVLLSRWNLHKIKPLKQALTLMQILQFFVMLAYLMAHPVLGCKYPAGVWIWYTFGYLVFVYLFLDFYRKSYRKVDKKVQ